MKRTSAFQQFSAFNGDRPAPGIELISATERARL
jgi:hypothetical protein